MPAVTAPTTDDYAAAQQPAGPVPRRERRALWIAAAAGGLLLVVWLVLYLLAGSGVPRGTTVQGVHIGGLSQAAAAAKVEQVFGPRAARPIAVEVGGRTDRLDPAVAGVRLDANGTVAQAGSRSWNPITLVKALVGDHSVQPLAVIDDAKLSAALDDLAERTGTRPVDGDVTFAAGRVVRVEPKQGVRLDVPTADERLADGYLSTAGPIELARPPPSPGSTPTRWTGRSPSSATRRCRPP